MISQGFVQEEEEAEVEMGWGWGINEYLTGWFSVMTYSHLEARTKTRSSVLLHECDFPLEAPVSSLKSLHRLFVCP